MGVESGESCVSADSPLPVQAHMDKYFERMREMLAAKGLPMRLRFMIEDIIELRECEVGGCCNSCLLFHQWSQQTADTTPLPTVASTTKLQLRPAAVGAPTAAAEHRPEKNQ